MEARLFGGDEALVRVGRFSLGAVLGSGAMGVVHRAYDDVLDRDVAIKLIPTRTRGSSPERLLREAKAMARVSHGNVVHVYEAGSYSRGVFVAMELVPGKTLREWLAEDGEKVGWRERLDKVVAAGQGLSQAHRAGVVHRDFKPENVLLSPQAEPKVSDFGLAGLMESSIELEQTATDLQGLTRTAGAVGTPLYMAPEVFDGQAADARSDQFAFCVTAYEAVFGRRPFSAATLEALRLVVTSGQFESTPSAAVDKEVVRAIARGLAVDPKDRWPSMEPLLAALRPRGRGPGWGTLLMGAIAVGGAAVGATLWTTTPEASACGDGTEALAEVWSPERRDALEASLLGRELSFAEDTWTRIAPRLDDYAERWRTRQVEACEWAERDAESVGAAARLQCLDRHRAALSATVERLLDPAEREAVIHAAELVEALPPLAECDEPEPVVDEQEPAQRAAADEVRQALAESGVLLAAGEFQRAAELASQATETVQAIESSGLHAAAWFALGRAQGGLKRFTAGVEAHTEAQRHALRAGKWELAADIASSLAVASAQRGSSEAPQAHLDVALGLADRGISAPVRARVQHRVGIVNYLQGGYSEAIAAFEQAVAQYGDLGERGAVARLEAKWDLGRTLAAAGELARAEQVQREALAQAIELRGAEHPAVAHGYTTLALLVGQAERTDEALTLIGQAIELGRRSMPDHPDVGMAEATQAGMLMAQGEFSKAIEQLEQLEQRWQGRLAPGHPTMITIVSNLGAAYLNSGQVRQSEAPHRAALEGALAANGAEHPKTASRRVALGATLQRLGRLAEAEQEYRTAAASLEQLGERHPAQLGDVEQKLADVLADQGHNDDALAHYRLALSLSIEAYGANHGQVAIARNNMATVLTEEGRLAEAEAEFELALAALEQALPAGHPYVINTMASLGDTKRRQGKIEAAIAMLERALEFVEQGEVPPQFAAETRHMLVLALVEQGGSRKRIRSLVDAALVEYARWPPGTADEQVAELKKLR